MAKLRLDTLLAQRGLFASRARAAASVMAGEVRLGGSGGERAAKPRDQLAAEAPRHPERYRVQPCGDGNAQGARKCVEQPVSRPVANP